MSTSPITVRGPLARYASDFEIHLLAVGYHSGPIRRQLQLVAQLSSWMDETGLNAADLVGERLTKFLDFRKSSGTTVLLSSRALEPVLVFLQSVGALVNDNTARATRPHGDLLDAYEHYLSVERSLVASTIGVYVREAAGAINRLVTRNSDLWSLSPRAMTTFVVSEVGSRGVASAKQMVNALNSLCRYLFVAGLTRVDLCGVIPGVPGWTAMTPPHAVDAHRVERLCESFDLATSCGRRDYAMVLLALRLGLRSFEVTSIRLEDLDWFAGELVVRGKGHVMERLPLPSDVGSALASYLSQSRPASEEQLVFLTEHAPTRGLSRSALGAVIARGCARAGIDRFGAHALRHTAATNALRAGAPLAEVSELLRHRSAASTARYAKVDFAALRPLAREWPVVAS